MKMSFTQEKMINIRPQWARPYFPQGDYCDGCDARCSLGYHYCKFGCHIYPTIDGKIIERYVDEKFRTQFTGDNTVSLNPTSRQAYQQKIIVKLFAGKIARYCDHYKTR